MSQRREMRVAAALIAAAVLFGAMGCSGSDERGTGRDSGASDELDGTLRVSAATSLNGAFEELIADFEADHPKVAVEVTYDSSGTLSDQIIAGAPVDVFASADEANVEKVADEDLTNGTAEVFARNQLVIVTKPGNPEAIQTLADLADVDGVVALCAQDAPCGKYAGEVLDNASVTIDESSVTRGQNAGATLTAVTEGDAVAGIVYVTDALGAGDAADSVEIPADDNAIANYSITALAGAEDALATAFIDLVRSDEGQRVLAEHGFLPPS